MTDEKPPSQSSSAPSSASESSSTSAPPPPPSDTSPEHSESSSGTRIETYTMVRGRHKNGHWTKADGTYTPHKRRTIRGLPEDAKHGRRISHELYEGIWEAYRDGIRGKNKLSKMFQLSWDTISRVIEDGYPAANWPALKDRLVSWDHAQYLAEQKRNVEMKALENDEWAKARKDNLLLAQVSKAAIATLCQKAVGAAKNAVFEKQKKILDKNGNVITTTLPANGFDVATALRTMAHAIEAIGKHESFWLGGPTDRTEIISSADKVLGLTAEQTKYIIEHNGALPPGMSDEEIFNLASQGGDAKQGN